MSGQETLFGPPPAPLPGPPDDHAAAGAILAVVEYVAGQLSHFSGLGKATAAERRELEAIAADALRCARAVRTP